MSARLHQTRCLYLIHSGNSWCAKVPAKVCTDGEAEAQGTGEPRIAQCDANMNGRDLR